MAGENVQDWSTTAATNSAADSSIGWAEGQNPSTVNNSARSMMAATAKWRDLLNGSKTTGGSENAQTLSSGVGFSSLPTGLCIRIKIGFTNTASTTLNVDSIGGVTIKDQSGSNLAGGELLLNSYCDFRYDGTNWVLLTPTRLPASTFSAGITATTGAFSSTLGATGRITGSAGVTVGGTLTGATTGAFSGAVSMAGLTATTGTFSSSITATNGAFSGTVSVGGGITNVGGNLIMGAAAQRVLYLYLASGSNAAFIDTDANGHMRFATGTSAVNVVQTIYAGGGVNIGTPIGGDKGSGALNANAVYDDNTLLTDYVFDKFLGRPHGTSNPAIADKYNELDQAMFTPGAFGDFWRANGRLYGMPDLNDCIEGKIDLPLGVLVQKLTQTVELQAIHIADLNARLAALEAA